MPTKIIVKEGDLLRVKAGHVVHGCNAQGVMGSGVAKAIRAIYPEVYADYRREYETNGLTLGVAYPFTVSSALKVWNAITQDQFGTDRRQVNYDAIATCFKQINDYIAVGHEGMADLQPNEIHIPMIGAGLGGGNWNIIKTIIEETVDYDVTLWVIPQPTLVA